MFVYGYCSKNTKCKNRKKAEKIEEKFENRRFGYLTVIERDPSKHKSHVYYKCRCDCGREKSIRKDSLKSGLSLSCGNSDCQYYKKNIRTSLHKKNKGLNRYDLSGGYGVGYTSKGEQFYFDIEDYTKIKDYIWYIDHRGYVRTNLNGGTRLHRLIMESKNDKMIDHIDGNKANNRKSNLRFVTNSQNQMNRDKPSNNTSGVKGVYWHKNKHKWQANLQVNGNLLYLGMFDDKEEAVKARKEAELVCFGHYSYLARS